MNTARTPSRPSQWIGLALGLVGAIAWVGAAAGCGSSGGGAASSDAGVNTGLDTIISAPGSPQPITGSTPPRRSSDEIRDWLTRDAAVLPSLARGEVPAGPTGPPPAANPTPTVTTEPSGAAHPDTATSLAPTAAAEASDALTRESRSTIGSAESSAERRSRLARDLAETLRRAVGESDTPLREYAALAAMELIEPGVAPDPSTLPALTPRDVELLGAWRDLFRSADERLTSDPGALADAVEALAESMSEWRTLGVAYAALCSRVDGFGQYQPLPTPRMLAGRDNAAIVYVEVENFTHRAAATATGETGYAVDLTQELSLYHDADGLLAWRSPAQKIHDVLRRCRRDFFIVQRIDLPSTLTVGAYRLKITLREESTGAVAEAVLPIEMVADAALVRAR